MYYITPNILIIKQIVKHFTFHSNRYPNHHFHGIISTYVLVVSFSILSVAVGAQHAAPNACLRHHT